MGGAESRSCENSITNPDIQSVITLSDAAVQRLPLSADENPLDQEMRSQNIDDYWRERLNCMDRTYAETLKITDHEFRRLESTIKNITPTGTGKLLCERNIEETQECYTTFGDEPLVCSPSVQKLTLCLDTLMQESTRKRHDDNKRKSARQKC